MMVFELRTKADLHISAVEIRSQIYLGLINVSAQKGKEAQPLGGVMEMSSRELRVLNYSIRWP